jgi:hypothetical protein
MGAQSILADLIHSLRASIQAEDPVFFPLACDLETLLGDLDALEDAFWHLDHASDEVELVEAIAKLVAALGGFAQNEGFSFEDTLVRLLQHKHPRLTALMTMFGIITFTLPATTPPSPARWRAAIDWSKLLTLLTQPQTMEIPLAASSQHATPSDAPRPPEETAVFLLTTMLVAPHAIAALLDPNGQFRVRALPVPTARTGGPWLAFRQATQNWTSFTIPLPLPLDDQAQPFPASVHDLAPGMEPDATITLAFHGYQDASSRACLEMWIGLWARGRSWDRDFVGSNWTLRIETGQTELPVLGLRWVDNFCPFRLFCPDDLGAAFMPPLDGAAEEGAPNSLTISARREGADGEPLFILGSPAGPHMLWQAIAPYLKFQLDPPLTELGVRFEDLTVAAHGQWLQVFDDAIAAGEGGLSFTFDLEAALVTGHGFRTSINDASFGAILGLDYLHVVNWTLGEAGCHVTIDTVRFRLSLVVDDPTQVPAVRAEVLITASGELGPLQASIQDVGSWLGYDPGQPAGLGRFMGFVPPSGMGLVLDAYPVTGGGFLRHEQVTPDIERYLGALQVKITEYSVSAFGIYERRPDYTSFVIVLGARFPGIQLGFGIALTGVGGIVGLHRCADSDALRLRLGTGAAGNVLFSDDPVVDAPALLDDLDAMFPTARGIFIVGPTVQLGWLALVRFDLGIIVELPGPSKIVILGSIRAELAAPILQIRLDVLGVVDFVHKVIEIDASLVNSKLLEIFDLTGDAAFRLSWGSRPYMLLSVGGFHPQFNPESLPVPPLERVAAGFDEKVAGVRVWLRIEGYLAITSNTFQLGSRTDAGVALGSLKAEGFLSFDALIQFKPFYFVIDIAAGFRIAYRSWTLGGIQVRGTLTGPPLTLQARFSFEILWFEISFRETICLGSTQPDELQPISSLLDVLIEELERPENLSALGGDDAEVTVETDVVDNRALVSPLGNVAWSQQRAPLDLVVERFEGVPLDPPQAAVLHPEPVETIQDWFSPGTYRELTESEALNQPPFARLQSGGVYGFGGERFPDPVSCPVVPPPPLRIKPTGEQDTADDYAVSSTVPGVVQDAIAGQSAPPTTYAAPPAITVVDPTYNLYGSDGSQTGEGYTAPDAYQQASDQGGTALPHGDTPLKIST